MATKNRSAAQTRSGDTRDKKKDKDKQFKADITVILTDAQAARFLKNAKVITAPELARQTGVKISAANRYLKNATESGTLKRVGGYSGHWLYQTAS